MTRRGPSTLRVVAAWFVILVLAVANGMLREGVLVPHLGVVVGTVTSGLLLAGLVLLVAWAMQCRDRIEPASRAWRIGACWLLATLAFEFGFGVARGKALAEILAPYTFTNGNLWPLVLVVVLVAPRVTRCLAASARAESV